MSSISAGTTSTTTLVHSGDTTGSLVFKTNDTGSGGTTAVTIDTSQNVGIGTTTPTNLVSLNCPVSSTKGLSIDFLGNAVAAMTANANTGEVRTGAVRSGWFPTIYSNGSEAMRIDSSGNLLVASTSNPYNARGYFVGNSTYGALALSAPGSGAYYPAWFNDSDATSTSQQLVHFTRNGTVVGYITTTNTATSYSSASDYRLKKDVQPMTNALEKVTQLKPVTYKWKSDGSLGEGFIAHELAEVCPIAVHGEKDAVDKDGNPDYQGIDTSFLVATLTAALQEAHGLIKDLQTRVAILEAK